MNYTAAVITVSDKGSRGERADESGPAIAEMLTAAGFDVVHRAIIPDEREEIARELIKCADELTIPLVLTTGGTGFSPRDITPEATLSVVTRRAPGIPEAMRAASLQVTNQAMLSRCEAGLRGGTLIVNLPGSPKAARENLAAVIDALQHGLQMLLEPGDHI
ncbi:MAG: MogA/MoaB family molybdenum cofactor biosynthesis protein [Oscillospiraceae bacterium]|nr:MogA/MoaB family molybdenum cofactor biosynthesis protein [Oscillospiraceae bacterium]